MSTLHGDTLALIAPGLKLTSEEVYAVQAAGVPIFAIANVALDLAPDAIAMYASDGPWWEHYHKALKDFGGRKFTQEATVVTKYGAEFGIEYSQWLHDEQRIPDKGFTTGCSSGEHALIIAHNEYRPKNILLVGFEYGAAGPGHYFGYHPTGVQSASHWPTMVNSFNKTAARLVSKGVNIVNCTPVSALDSLPKKSIGEALEGLQGGALKTRRIKAGS